MISQPITETAGLVGNRTDNRRCEAINVDASQSRYAEPTHSVNARADALPPRPVVLLAIVDQHVRATHAYVLSAAGFEVVIPDAIGAAFFTRRPDVVLIDLTDPGEDADQSAKNFIRDLRGDDPIVGLVPNVERSSCERARRVGCTVVCVSTCPANVLAASLRAVLRLSRGQTGRVHDE
jgi:DNA-binding response OmpR family regulator